MKIRKIAFLVTLTTLLLPLPILSFIESGTSLKSNNPINYLGTESKPFGQFTNIAKIPIWDRENTFINYNLFKRQGIGPRLLSVDESNHSLGYKPIKVLLIGDSFIWGDGVSNINTSTGIALQDKLDELTKPGLFHVILFAQTGASTYTYLDLLDKKFLDETKPDAIVYAYYTNDSIPNFDESIICKSKLYRCEKFSPQTTPTYQNCIDGKTGLLQSAIRIILRPLYPAVSQKLLLNLCEPALKKLKTSSYDDQYLWDHPWSNPWINTWKEALYLLRNKAPKTPFYISQLYYTPVSPAADKFYHTNFKSAGFTDIEMSSTKEVLKTHFTPELALNPVNNHANFILTTAYAQDIATALTKNYNPSQNPDFSLGPDFKKRFNLISTTLPSNITISQNTPSYFSAEFKLDRKHFFPHKVTGVEAGHQFVSCALLDHPYLQFNLSRYLTKGTLTINSSRKDLYLYLVSYDSSGKKIIQATGKTVGEINQVTLTGDRSYEVLLLDRSSLGCSINQDITFPDVKITGTFKKL